MNLPTQVGNKQCEARAAGFHATKLFLGQCQQEQLMNLMEDYNKLIYSNQAKTLEGVFNGAGGNRLEFMGLKVYQIDDFNYCEVGK